MDIAAESLFDAVQTPCASTHAERLGDGGGGVQNIPTPRIERRSAALVLKLAELRAWIQTCLQLELPPGDLPTLLEDGELLLALADAA